jgi:hypothetical protein
MDWDGIKMLLQRVDEHFPRLKHLYGWTPATGERIGARTG